MKAPSGSVLSWCLALAVALTLSSCASFGRPATTLTPRSEQVCDSSPPAPIPPIADTHPELEAIFRQVLGLYRDEVTKHFAEAACKAGVRRENAEAARRAR